MRTDDRSLRLVACVLLLVLLCVEVVPPLVHEYSEALKYGHSPLERLARAAQPAFFAFACPLLVIGVAALYARELMPVIGAALVSVAVGLLVSFAVSHGDRTGGAFLKLLSIFAYWAGALVSFHALWKSPKRERTGNDA